MTNAFKKLLSSAEKAKHMDTELCRIGYSSNTYADIFDNIADAIYNMLGENTKTFESSFTYVLLNTNAITIDAKAKLLTERFKKNLKI